MVAAVDIVNQSLELIASQQTITALNDGSIPGNAAGIIYTPLVQMLLRAMDPDFARKKAGLTLIAAPAPIVPWAYEFQYPADCLRLRQLAPPVNSYDPYDPPFILGEVAFDTVAASPARVILTNQVSVLGIYTTSSVTENQWDADFEQAVVRQLANPLAMAIAGRPDFARELLDEANTFASMADLSDESSVR